MRILRKQSDIAKCLKNEALEQKEDEEDIREGLKALEDAEGTISWEEYQARRKGKSRGGQI